MAAEFRIMGVVNVTPDSFSDGGLFLEPAAALDHARRMAAEGADILDIGGESTRPPGVRGPHDPGAAPVSAEEERSRVIPVIEGLAGAGTDAQISIDTSKSAVAEAAVDAGASYI